MIASSEPTSEVEILSRLVSPSEPSLDRQFANWVLGIRFDEETQVRIRDLLERNNNGELTAAERELLEKYLRVGQFVDLLHAKARLTIAASE